MLHFHFAIAKLKENFAVVLHWAFEFKSLQERYRNRQIYREKVPKKKIKMYRYKDRKLERER